MTSIVLDGPESVTLSDTPLGDAPGGDVAREARLLVAGEYPRKGLTVTEADLDALVAHFSGPVPVKVEHVDSPLDPLGVVEKVWRDGTQLMGTIRFPAAMASFLSERGAAKLSVGLLGEPAWRLLEASLTLTPHVPTATLLSDGERGELARLRAERLDAEVARWKAAGKLTPAAEPFARALLSAPVVVTLSDGQPAGDAFRRFLDALPPVVRLGELAPGAKTVTLNGGASAAAITEEEGERMFSETEAEVLRRLGVAPADVAQTLARDKAQDRKKGNAHVA